MNNICIHFNKSNVRELRVSMVKLFETEFSEKKKNGVFKKCGMKLDFYKG